MIAVLIKFYSKMAEFLEYEEENKNFFLLEFENFRISQPTVIQMLWEVIE